MNLKKLNEEMKKLLKEDKEGFLFFNGTNKDFGEWIENIKAQYGDLTIPEFIDKLIQAEQKGEEILEERLNEEVEFSDIDKICKKVVSKTKKGFTIYNFPIQLTGGTVRYQDLLFTPIHEKVESVSHIAGEWTNTHDKIIYRNSDLNVEFTLVFHTNHRLRQDAVDRNSFIFRILSFSGIGYESSKDLVDKLNRLWPEYSKKSNYFKDSDNEINPYYGEDCEIFVDSIDEAVQEVIECIQDYFDLANSKEWGKQYKDNYSSRYQKELDDIEKLKQSRKEARANRNAANTTVTQALTQEDIIAKIQSLQNLTPEQLAKILAAIE